MTLSSTRGIVRVARNLDCELQAAMVAERVDEPDFFVAVTGTRYPGEYGERASARRRGSKFESNLHDNDAAKLRSALAPLFGYESDDMVVRSFADELPGVRDSVRAARLVRMRRILADLAAGREVPHLIIQPQFRLIVGPSPAHTEHVSPDFLVLDLKRGMYIAGEEKSFITREGMADDADKELTRRQAAVQILALGQEAGRHGLGDRVGEDAVFVFATPFGLAPAVPVIEFLPQEIFEATRAMELIRQVRLDLEALRMGNRVDLANLVDDLPVAFRESCISSCILASFCEMRQSGHGRLLGDTAADVLGDSVSITRALELLDGAGAAGPEEEALAVRLRAADDLLGVATRARRSA